MLTIVEFQLHQLRELMPEGRDIQDGEEVLTNKSENRFLKGMYKITDREQQLAKPIRRQLRNLVNTVQTKNCL